MATLHARCLYIHQNEYTVLRGGYAISQHVIDEYNKTQWADQERFVESVACLLSLSSVAVTTAGIYILPRIVCYVLFDTFNYYYVVFCDYLLLRTSDFLFSLDNAPFTTARYHQVQL